MKYELGSNSSSDILVSDISTWDDEKCSAKLVESVVASEIVALLWILENKSLDQLKRTSMQEALLLACTAGLLSHVYAFLDFGFSADFMSETEETPISSAAAFGNDAIVSCLANRGVKLNTKPSVFSEEIRLIVKNCSSLTTADLIPCLDPSGELQLSGRVLQVARELGRHDVLEQIKEAW